MSLLAVKPQQWARTLAASSHGQGISTAFPEVSAILVLFLCFLFSNQSTALTWRWSNPLPNGNNIVDMDWNGTTAVQVGDLGQIYTGLGFFGWQPRDSGTTNTLQAVRFFGNRIVFVGATGTVGYSDDSVNFTATSLNTADWLVDLAVSSNLVVAVGDNAVIFSSADGVKWSYQTNAPNAGQNWLLSVAWGSGRFVTTGEGGYVATSPDGARWTSRNSGTTSALTRVTWVGTTNGSSIFPYTGFWAVTADGKALYSSNLGVTWQPFSLGASTNVLYTVTANFGTGLVAGNTEVRLGTSSNNWASQLSGTFSPAPTWTYYSALWDSTNEAYRLVGEDGMMVEGDYTNQTYLWSEQYPGPREWLWQVTIANDLYVAVGDNAHIMTSANGIDWNVEAIPLTNSTAGSATNTVFFCTAGNTNVLLAAGNRGSLAVSPAILVPVLVTNIDGSVFTNYINSQGLVWFSQNAPTTNDLSGACAFGTNLVLVGGNATVLLSADGTNWAKMSAPTTNYLSGVAASTNLIVATGDNGIIVTSTDGRTWTKRTSGTTNWLFRVRWLGTSFVAMGENGVLLRSATGLSWTAANSGTTNWLNDAVLVSNACYMVGNNGTVISSTNLVNWTNVPSVTGHSLYGVATRNGQLVSVGIQGTILRSQVIPDLTPVSFVNYAQENGENVFVVAGQPDQQFTLDSSNDLTNWTTGPTLDLIYGSGTLLFITPTGTNPPPVQYFRATLVP